jgi:MFS family permease
MSRQVPAARDRAQSARQDLAEAWRYVRAHAWIWVTLASAALSLLASYGPLEVLLPYVIKNDLERDADTFGFVLGAGGLGAVVAALVVGRIGMPRRAVTMMFAAWTIATLLTGAFALATSPLHMYVIAFVAFAGNAVGMIVWNTLMHTLVPDELLGRVSSVDWFVSIGLIPVSFALTGPIAELVGAKATLIGAGVLGAAGMAGLFFAVPAVREPERAWAR